MIIPIGDINPRRTVPVVTYGLLAINIGVFILMLGLTGGGREEVMWRFGFIPALVTQMGPLEFFQERGYTLITALFVHANLAHLIGNMLFLWIAGDNVEDRLGHVPFALFYLAGGLGAFFAHYLGEWRAFVPTIGASGAIAGVLGAYVVWFPRHQIRFFYFLLFFIGTFEVSAFWAIGFWFIEQLWFASMFQNSRAAAGVAYWAHVGGFIFGAAVALAVNGLARLAPDREEKAW